MTYFMLCACEIDLFNLTTSRRFLTLPSLTEASDQTARRVYSMWGLGVCVTAILRLGFYFEFSGIATLTVYIGGGRYPAWCDNIPYLFSY